MTAKQIGAIGESFAKYQYNPNYADDFRLTAERLMSCVETLYAAPKS